MKELKSRYFVVRVTPSQFSTLKNDAQSTGAKFSAYVRDRLLTPYKQTAA